MFGRNPDVPEDLLNEPLRVVSATASLTDDAISRANKVRATARQAVIQLQDDRSLKLALAARPRVVEDHRPGARVAYWRNQKWIQGKLQLGGRWYGTAIVLGKIGRNYVIAHRKTVLRVAPEQLRSATSEECSVLETPQVELLGIKDMLEGGTFMSKQYVDLTSQSYPSVSPETASPTVGESQIAHNPSPIVPLVSTPSPTVPSLVTPSNVVPPADVEPVAPAVKETTTVDSSPCTEPVASSAMPPEQASSSYGPIRRKVVGKDGPDAIWRPPTMRQEDFVSIMQEVTPQLLDTLLSSASDDQSMPSVSKRSVDKVDEPVGEPPSAARVRTKSPAHEALFVETLDACEGVDVMIAEYLKHKMNKELPHSNNPPDIQRKVDLGKRTEWETMTGKPDVVKIHYGKHAERIKKEFPDRFIGSRYVLTRKAVDEAKGIDNHDPNSYTVKGRWCLQGHLDPDLQAKAEEGKLQSPTLSQLSRMVLMQIIASHRWSLQLGDIKAAFLESGPLDPRYKPLFAHQPPGGIPGLPSTAVIEVLGNIYGQNDAPAAWFNTFQNEVISGGWVQSKFDCCLFTLRSSSTNELIGIMGVHVDDTALGGSGPEFEQAVAKLRSRFPYRKWRIGSGEFCGAFYRQCSETMAISMSMQTTAERMRPANIKKGISPETPLDSYQTRTLRGINGSLNWLATQSRPDLSAQTSISQQAFPHPKIKHLRHANNVVRRARMHSDLSITFKPIDPTQLTVVCHSDEAFANMGVYTQAGHILAFTEKKLQDGFVSTWCPLTWRSHKLSRVVSSTLAAESQSLSIAAGTVEWVMLLLSEVLDGPFLMKSCRAKLATRKPILAIDCKSLFDHLMSPSAPTAIEDRRTSIDVAIIRESLRSMMAHLRWVPTDRMLADALTKDQGDPLDLLRSCIKSSQYQISPEDHVLQLQSQERQERMSRKVPNAIDPANSAE